jgi:hypothetical protein
MALLTRHWPVVQLSKEEAAEVLRGAAFTNEEDGRTTVHSFLGTIGADHDLDDALARVEKSDDRAWVTHMIQHDLAVLVNGKQYHYDVQRPERSPEPPHVRGEN